MQDVTITIGQDAGTPQSNTRHFEVHITDLGTITLKGADDQYAVPFASDSPGAALLRSFLTPRRSLLDRTQITDQHWMPQSDRDTPDPLASSPVPPSDLDAE